MPTVSLQFLIGSQQQNLLKTPELLDQKDLRLDHLNSCIEMRVPTNGSQLVTYGIL